MADSKYEHKCKGIKMAADGTPHPLLMPFQCCEDPFSHSGSGGPSDSPRIGCSLSPQCNWGSDCKGNHTFTYQKSESIPDWGHDPAPTPELSENEAISLPRVLEAPELSKHVFEPTVVISSDEESS